MPEIPVSFCGPFSWPGAPDAPSVFDVEEGHKAGIYLFTIPLPHGYLIYYVGETGREFRVRLCEHYKEHASAMYHIYSPAEFAHGEKRLLWPGRYDSTNRKSARECIENYARLCESIREMAFMFRFFLAPLSCEDRNRKRIEAAIALGLYRAPGIVGTFQDEGIRYEPKWNSEEPIECVVTSPIPVLGLPDRFQA